MMTIDRQQNRMGKELSCLVSWQLDFIGMYKFVLLGINIFFSFYVMLSCCSSIVGYYADMGIFLILLPHADAQLHFF